MTNIPHADALHFAAADFWTSHACTWIYPMANMIVPYSFLIIFALCEYRFHLTKSSIKESADKLFTHIIALTKGEQRYSTCWSSFRNQKWVLPNHLYVLNPNHIIKVLKIVSFFMSNSLYSEFYNKYRLRY